MTASIRRAFIRNLMGGSLRGRPSLRSGNSLPTEVLGPQRQNVPLRTRLATIGKATKTSDAYQTLFTVATACDRISNQVVSL
jgi:hypothetical protein